MKLLLKILKNFRTLKAKLLFSFFVFLFLTCLIVIITFWFETRQDTVEKVANRFITASLQLQFMRKLEADFFVEDAMNTTFFETGLSQTLSQRQKLVATITEDFNFLLASKEIIHFGVEKELQLLSQQVKAYQAKFEEVLQAIRQKGFKGYGLEGTMRKAIHALENYQPPLDLAQILMIRRHEKDFILRKEKSYLQKHTQAIHKLLQDIRQQNLPQNIKDKQANLLIEYANTFQKFAEIDMKIGVSYKYGLKKDLSHLSHLIDKQSDFIRKKIESQIQILPRQIFTTLIIILLVYIAIISFLAFYITKALSQPISDLSQSIHRVIESNFSDEVEFKKIRTKDEIGKLSKDFFFMYSKVKSSLQEIREKNEKIEKKQRILMDGLRYAQKVQAAILPDLNFMKLYFTDVQVIYKPLHEVSGDFYWFWGGNNKCITAVVDCTGHGVSGAFMSMIGHTLLNEIVNEKKIHEPADILELLHLEIVTALNQEKGRNNDGMDIAICVIEQEDLYNRKLTFAGAKRPLYYLQNQQLKELKGNRHSLGGYQKWSVYNEKPFYNEVIHLKTNDRIYLLSDGFTDQPDKDRKKYGTKRLLNFLQTHAHTSLEQQKALLEADLQGQLQEESLQRDDITLLLIEL